MNGAVPWTPMIMLLAALTVHGAFAIARSPGLFTLKQEKAAVKEAQKKEALAEKELNAFMRALDDECAATSKLTRDIISNTSAAATVDLVSGIVDNSGTLLGDANNELNISGAQLAEAQTLLLAAQDTYASARTARDAVIRNLSDTTDISARSGSESKAAAEAAARSYKSILALQDSVENQVREMQLLIQLVPGVAAMQTYSDMLFKAADGFYTALGNATKSRKDSAYAFINAKMRLANVTLLMNVLAVGDGGARAKDIAGILNAGSSAVSDTNLAKTAAANAAQSLLDANAAMATMKSLISKARRVTSTTTSTTSTTSTSTTGTTAIAQTPPRVNGTNASGVPR